MPRKTSSSLRRHRARYLLRSCALVLLPLATSTISQAQAPHPPAVHPSTTATIPQRTPREWAVLACNNEIEAVSHDGPFLRYRTHVIDSKGDRNRIVIESKDGTVARTIAINGKPLTPDDDAAERSRLQGVASSPTEFARHIKSDTTGKKLAIDLIRLMPDAMIYTPVPGQEHARSPSGAPLVVFDYAPNPNWTPPTTTAEALTGLRGRVWVDASTGWVTRMDGEIFRPVNFGWGMLARLYPGGRVSVEQSGVGHDRWIYTHFQDDLHVRALLLKTLEVKTEVTASDFQFLPGPLTYQQAIQLLLNAPN